MNRPWKPTTEQMLKLSRANFIVTRDEHGSDRVFAGTKNGLPAWTWQPDQMQRFSGYAASVLIQDFHEHDHGDGPRIVSGHPVLGPRVVTTGKPDYRMIVIGC